MLWAIRVNLPASSAWSWFSETSRVSHYEYTRNPHSAMRFSSEPHALRQAAKIESRNLNMCPVKVVPHIESAQELTTF